MEVGGRADNCHRDLGPNSKADSQGQTLIMWCGMPCSKLGAIDPHGDLKSMRAELKE